MKITITCNGVQRTIIQQFVALEDIVVINLGGFSNRWKKSDFAISFLSLYIIRTQMSCWKMAKKQTNRKVSTWWKELIEQCCNETNWICSWLYEERSFSYLSILVQLQKEFFLANLFFMKRCSGPVNISLTNTVKYFWCSILCGKNTTTKRQKCQIWLKQASRFYFVKKTKQKFGIFIHTSSDKVQGTTLRAVVWWGQIFGQTR